LIRKFFLLMVFFSALQVNATVIDSIKVHYQSFAMDTRFGLGIKEMLSSPSKIHRFKKENKNTIKLTNQITYTKNSGATEKSGPGDLRLLAIIYNSDHTIDTLAYGPPSMHLLLNSSVYSLNKEILRSLSKYVPRWMRREMKHYTRR
jgi:hypothetical protein